MKQISVISIIALLLCSCSNIKYVPVVQREVETKFKLQTIRDSTFIHDSIYVMVKGDTVIKYRDRYVYRDRIQHDTISHVDTVYREIAVPVEKPVAQPLKWYQSLLMKLGAVALLAILAVVIRKLLPRLLKV